MTKGAFLVKDDRVFKRATGSLATFVRLHRSLRSLASQRSALLCSLRYARFAMLASLARYVQGLAHSLRSLPRGTVEILEDVFTLLLRFTGTNAFLALTRNTPLVQWIHLRQSITLLGNNYVVK